MKVNPWTFEPMRGGMEITPLRAYAHQVPRYYIQNFGSGVSHPNTNEYALFAQDTVRLTQRLAVSLGVRYDLQTFRTEGLRSNPLWPDAGKLPRDGNNIAPRVGIAYSIGDEKPLVIRAGYGFFYPRIPQIYNSAVETDNGLASTNLILDNTNYYDHQISARGGSKRTSTGSPRMAANAWTPHRSAPASGWGRSSSANHPTSRTSSG